MDDPTNTRTYRLIRWTKSKKEKVSTFSLVTNNAWSAFKAIKHLDIEILHNSSKLHLKGK